MNLYNLDAERNILSCVFLENDVIIEGNRVNLCADDFFYTQHSIIYTYMKKKQGANCEYCVNYSYDDDYECYTCDMNLDEDEMYRFITGTYHDCPYFRMGDEYRVVRKQM